MRKEAERFFSIGVSSFGSGKSVADRIIQAIGAENLALRSSKRILIVGAGALGTPIGITLGRMGYNIVYVDGETVGIENFANQWYFESDLGKNKAIASAKNTAMLSPLPIEAGAIPYFFQDALDLGYDLDCDLAIATTDSLGSRFEVCYHFYNRLPVISAGLSENTTFAWIFIQIPQQACLRCAFPHVDPATPAACSGAAVEAALLATAQVCFAVDTLMINHETRFRENDWNFRRIFLPGDVPDEVKRIERREDCDLCMDLHAASRSS